jgi:hypothetical protein
VDQTVIAGIYSSLLAGGNSHVQINTCTNNKIYHARIKDQVLCTINTVKFEQRVSKTYVKYYWLSRNFTSARKYILHVYSKFSGA